MVDHILEEHRFSFPPEQCYSKLHISAIANFTSEQKLQIVLLMLQLLKN